MKTDQNLTLTLILTLTLTINLTITLSLTIKKESKERNLEKGKKKKTNSGFELLKCKTNRIAYDNPTNCARWQFVPNYIFSLLFIAQHVIDKKLVLSLTRLSFPLVRFRHNPGSVIITNQCGFQKKRKQKMRDKKKKTVANFVFRRYRSKC